MCVITFDNVMFGDNILARDNGDTLYDADAGCYVLDLFDTDAVCEYV